MNTISDHRLAKVQAATGVAFATFLLAHLVNTWLAVGGPILYDGVQAALRAVYQFFVLEVLLMASLVAHAAIGVLRIRRRPRGSLTPRSRWHRYAGIFLLVFVFGHIAAVRGPSLVLDVYPQFSGLSFTMAAFPWFFYPYYTLLATAGFFHGLNGIGIAAGRFGVRLRVTQRMLTTCSGVALVATVLALLAFGGQLFEVADPMDNDFARLALKLIADLAG